MIVEWARHGGEDCLRVTGLPATTLRALRVYPSESVDGEIAPIQSVSGRLVIEDDAVCFVPRFPFVDGTSYTVIADGTANDSTSDAPAVATIARPRVEPPPSTSVVEVYPTAPTLPRNQLKLYVEFSDPMSEGVATQHITIRRADGGEPLPHTFFPLDPELWDRDRGRLTVLFDPARIKRGLIAHRRQGYPLRVGEPIEVVIDRAFPDAEGRPLVRTFVKRYDVDRDVRERVDPGRWKLEPPATGTTDPLRVEFDRPLDHALVQRCLSIIDGDQHHVGGHAFIGVEERSWEFVPKAPWHHASYTLVVDPILEDLAGNSVTRVFDRDLAEPADSPTETQPVTIEFRPS